MNMKKLLALVLAAVMCIGVFAGCQQEPQGNDPVVVAPDPIATFAGDELVIIYTSDVHNGYERTDERMGYAALAHYAKSLEAQGKNVLIMDGGDAIQGEAVGTLSKGKYLVELMNKVGYDLAIPGNHEFDFGLDTFVDLAKNVAAYDYVSCNFMDKDGNTVFDAYKTVKVGEKTVAFVGITTPEVFTKSTPTFFQDENGNYIYNFCEGNNGQDLYNAVQKAIDDAKAAGADYVVAVGHLGIDGESSPWTSKEVIANTTGLVAFLDGHSHSLIHGQAVADKAGKPVTLVAASTKLEKFAEITINCNIGSASVQMIKEYAEDDADTLAAVQTISAGLEDLLSEVVATSEVELITHDADGNRLVRKQETNLGDLCADAYRALLGSDVAFVNGGGVRAPIGIGDVTYGDIIAVHPFNNMACMVKVKGQVILDALELAYSALPGESGGFLHVSGLTCEVDTSIESTVVTDDKGAFVEVSGARRVSNVLIGGEPIDANKEYTVGSHNFMLKSGGDGYAMFLGSEVIINELMVDNQVLITYIQDNLNGIIPAEQYAEPAGRVVIK